MPPMRGIGVACTLRSPGRSSRRKRPAALASGGINATVIVRATTSSNSSCMALRRNVRAESGNQRAREILERLVGVGFTLPGKDRRGEAQHRTVGAIARQRIPEDVPLHQVFVGE